MKRKNTLFESLLNRIREIILGNQEKAEKLTSICFLLMENVTYYDWVGFYLIDPENDKELVLGPFAGEPTEHIRISFGSGICGQAAGHKKTLIVQDVSREMNYLSCSVKVKSEIVVPMFKHGSVIGELDIDSHTIAPFSGEDKGFLGKAAELVSEIL